MQKCNFFGKLFFLFFFSLKCGQPLSTAYLHRHINEANSSLGTVQVLHKPLGGGGVSQMLILAYGGRGESAKCLLLTAYRGMRSQENFGAAHPLREVTQQHAINWLN